MAPVEKIFSHIVMRKVLAVAEEYVRFMYNHFDATVAASDLMAERLSDMGVQRIHKIPLGVDLDLFHPCKRDAAFRESLRLGDNDILLVYSGRVDSEKRIDILLKAFDYISGGFGGALIIIGNGPSKQKVEHYAKKNPKIHFFQYNNDREFLSKILASADIYVTAGPHETFGLSVVEAQASGLPVVGVRAGALLERVPESVGILGEVDSPESLARNILNLSLNGFRIRGKNARRYVEMNLSWEKTFNKLFDLYDHVVQSKTN